MWNPVRGQPRHAALLLNTLVGVFLTTVVAAAEVPAHGRSIAELLPRGQQTEGIFFSILPARSEDGRDAIRLPKLAETLLPSDSEAADETRFTVTTHWAASRETQSFPVRLATVSARIVVRVASAGFCKDVEHPGKDDPLAESIAGVHFPNPSRV